MKHILRIVSLFSLLLMTACGGGGGGSTETVISGVASKGLLVNGTVTVFALNAIGDKGTQLGTGATDSFGAYHISIGNYSGPVLVEAYGTYTDEATNSSTTVPVGAPLRAVMGQVSGAVSVSVTPLTELAVLQAKQVLLQAGHLTVADVDAINARISALFKFDILAVTPAAPTAAAFQASSTTQSQKDYALVLAAVSQMMKQNGQNLKDTIDRLNNSTTAVMAGEVATAASNFVSTSSNSPVSTLAGSSVLSIGTTPLNKIAIALTGSSAASVKGIQATLNLPAGVVLRAAATGETEVGVIKLADAVSSGIIVGKYTASVNGSLATVELGLVTTANLAAGDILTLNADLAPGVTAPAISAFSFSASTFKDFNGAALSGASLTLKYL